MAGNMDLLFKLMAMEQQKKAFEYQQQQDAINQQQKATEWDIQKKIYDANLKKASREEAAAQIEPEVLRQITGLMQPSVNTGQAPTYTEAMGDVGDLIAAYGGNESQLKLAQDLFENMYGAPGKIKNMAPSEILSLLPGDDRGFGLSLEPEAAYDHAALKRLLKQRQAGWQQYQEGLQEYNDYSTANKMKVVGESTEYPGMVLVEDSFGQQYLRPGKGPVVSQTLGELTSEENNRIATFNTLLDSAKNMKQLFNSDSVGPFVGRLKNLGSKFIEDPDYVDLRREVIQNVRLVYALSGKAINEKELEKIVEGFLPDPNAPPANFVKQVDKYEKFLLNELKTYEDTLRRNRKYVGPSEQRGASPWPGQTPPMPTPPPVPPAPPAGKSGTKAGPKIVKTGRLKDGQAVYKLDDGTNMLVKDYEAKYGAKR